MAGGYYTCDAYHLTEPRPDGEGVKRCIEEALRTSGVEAAEVDYVNAHATSTPAGDIVEYKVRRRRRRRRGRLRNLLLALSDIISS